MRHGLLLLAYLCSSRMLSASEVDDQIAITGD